MLSGDISCAVVSSNDRIYYIALHSALLKGYKIKVTELVPATGKPVGQSILLSSENDITSKESIAHVGANSGVPYLVWFDKTLTTLKANALGTKQIASFNVPTGSGKPAEEGVVHAPRSAAAESHFLVHYKGADSHWAEVYHVALTGIKKAFDLNVLEGRGTFSASSHGATVHFMRHAMQENALISSTDPSILNKWDSQPAGGDDMTQSQEPDHAASEVIPRGGSSHAVRSVLSFPSGNWELIRNGDSSWVRVEGLAGAVAASFIDVSRPEALAKELALEGQSGPLAAYLHRVKRHIKDLQDFPAWAQAIPERLLGSLLGDQPFLRDQDSRRDSFGFHKSILVATEQGRLVALDSDSQGRLLWTTQAVKLKPGQKWNVLSIEDEGGTSLVRGKGGEFLRVDSDNGAILQYQPGGMIDSLKTTITVINDSGDQVLIPIKEDGTLGSVSTTSLSKGTFVVTLGIDNAVKGWSLGRGSQPSLAWQFKPEDGEKIVNIVARPSHDPVASIGKALGDRNVLYKYLNPNLVWITTVNAELSIGNFFLLDSASGAVIHSISHPSVDTDKPIVSVISENWFAYSLFSETTASTPDVASRSTKKIAGYQLVVAELYESPFPNDRGLLGPSLNTSSIYPTTEGEGDITNAPHIVSQSYLIPGPVSYMSVTSTLQGITTRSLLCVAADSQAIVSISRAILDPRRPVGRDPTAAEMEEGLFRYNPILDFEPKWILNHKRELLSISDVITKPSLLESTSLVFAFGDVDLFGTRTAPIGAFDILGKGFSKLQLVLTVVALAVGTMVVAPFVSLPSLVENTLLLTADS